MLNKNSNLHAAWTSFLHRTVSNFTSVKFYLIVLTTSLLLIDKIDAATWQQTVLLVAGIRAVSEVASMFKPGEGPKTNGKSK